MFTVPPLLLAPDANEPIEIAAAGDLTLVPYLTKGESMAARAGRPQPYVRDPDAHGYDRWYVVKSETHGWLDASEFARATGDPDRGEAIVRNHVAHIAATVVQWTLLGGCFGNSALDGDFATTAGLCSGSVVAGVVDIGLLVHRRKLVRTDIDDARRAIGSL